MSKEFCLGLALGMIGGALIVANSKKVRHCIQDKQTKILDKLKKADNSQSKTNYQ